MKTLFYDRAKKPSPAEDNETKKYSTQTCTEGFVKDVVLDEY
jgi:hypothetical protein